MLTLCYVLMLNVCELLAGCYLWCWLYLGIDLFGFADWSLLSFTGELFCICVDIDGVLLLFVACIAMFVWIVVPLLYVVIGVYWCVFVCDFVI